MSDNKIQVIDFREQFFRVGNDIFEMKLDVYEISVYALLCRYVNNDSKMCYPSLSKICNILGIGRAKLINTLNSLIQKHIIYKESGNRVKSNKYYLLNIGSSQPELVPNQNHGSSQPEPRVVPVENCKKTKLKRLNKKTHYKDNVLLTKEEHTKLVDEHGVSKVNDMIDNLSLYKHSSGRPYKSDYHTILSWERKNNKGAKKSQTLEEVKAEMAERNRIRDSKIVRSDG